MAFYGYEFLFDNVSSSIFGLFISDLESSGVINSPMGSSVTPSTKKILRNPIEYIYSVEQGPVLEFDLSFNSATPISAYDRNLIGSVLFGQAEYKKLQIVQPDLQDIYFNCIITSATATYVGNLHYGWRCHIRCDSPYAYEFPKIYQRTNTSGGIWSELININNLSVSSDYTYPLVVFTTNGIGTSFSITNLTDANRVFAFGGISANETISVDNHKQIIKSSTGLMRISYFNLNWLRLLPGINVLNVVGGYGTYNIVYTPLKKIGG